MSGELYAGLPGVVLASFSPRRAELLRGMGVQFTVQGSDVDEQEVGRGVATQQLPARLARYKAEAVAKDRPELLVIGADTLVVLGSEQLHKPKTHDAGCALLQKLSGRVHSVLTGVCLAYRGRSEVFTSCTEVAFRELQRDEIDYYVRTFKPYDKAGGYGIQEWIGLVGVEWIRGSYTNVVGLPTEALSVRLLRYVKKNWQ